MSNIDRFGMISRNEEFCEMAVARLSSDITYGDEPTLFANDRGNTR